MRRRLGILLFAFSLTACATAEVYHGLGEQRGINQIVETLVPLLLADGRVGSSFDEADLVRLKTKLAEQFCALSGGPCTYGGKDMRTIHDGLNVTRAQFNALAEDLQLAMTRNGVAPRIQNRLLARLAPMQRDVVTK